MNCWGGEMDNNAMEIFIKNRIRGKHQFQFFMHGFVEASIKLGFKAKREVGKGGRLQKYETKLCRGLMQMTGRLWHKLMVKDKALLVTSRGQNLFSSVFPYYRYKVIPMIWDVWPGYWETLYADLRLLQCDIVFVTVRQMAEKLKADLGIKAYWIPEGIDLGDYCPGNDLFQRSIDVYELGRQKQEYNVVIENVLQTGGVKSLVRNEYATDGSLLKLAYPTAESLLRHLPEMKIIVSFPQCDTHPENAGNLETLTQRYWEAMLSRCLIVGRAPKELTDLIGYNPVIDVDWKAPEDQLTNILSHIADYQEYVNKNYTIALKYASWDNRIKQVKSILVSEGYNGFYNDQSAL